MVAIESATEVEWPLLPTLENATEAPRANKKMRNDAGAYAVSSISVIITSLAE